MLDTDTVRDNNPAVNGYFTNNAGDGFANSPAPSVQRPVKRYRRARRPRMHHTRKPTPYEVLENPLTVDDVIPSALDDPAADFPSSRRNSTAVPEIPVTSPSSAFPTAPTAPATEGSPWRFPYPGWLDRRQDSGCHHERLALRFPEPRRCGLTTPCPSPHSSSPTTTGRSISLDLPETINPLPLPPRFGPASP